VSCLWLSDMSTKYRGLAHEVCRAMRLSVTPLIPLIPP
jgi:hypothetical protein